MFNSCWRELACLFCFHVESRRIDLELNPDSVLDENRHDTTIYDVGARVQSAGVDIGSLLIEHSLARCTDVGFRK